MTANTLCNFCRCFLTAVISIPRTQENALCCAYKNNVHKKLNNYEIRNFRKSKLFKRENR